MANGIINIIKVKRGRLMKKIEFVDLKAQNELIGRQIKQAVDQVISHGKFIMGPEVFDLEKELCNFTGSQYAVSCASGTDALLMSLMALGIGPGDAVFTTPFTFIATAEVIRLLGAVPVFVDIDGDTFNLDPDKLDKAIAEVRLGKKLNMGCIIPVDIFGLPADYGEINKIAAKYGLKVIGDGAQSLGSRIGNTCACSLTDISTTSFFPAKPLGCYGDGGAIFTNNEDFYEKLVSIRLHGKGNHKYDNVRLGINGRLDTIQAAILIEKLKIFEGELKTRDEIASKYRAAIGEQVRTQKIPEDCTSAWAQFSFVTEKREKIVRILQARDVPCAIYYPKPLHLQKAFENLRYKKGDLPVSEAVAESILSLPMHPYLSNDQVAYISNAMLDALN